MFSTRQSPLGRGLLIHEVSRSHTTTHHSRYDSSGRVISSSQRPLPENTQHSQQTDIHASRGIWIHNLIGRAVADPRFRPRSRVSVFDRPVADRTVDSTTWNFITSPVLTGRSNDQAVVHARWSVMNRNSIIAVFLLYRRRKRRRDRLHWVHPEIKKKEEFGAFYTLFGKLGDEANRF